MREGWLGEGCGKDFEWRRLCETLCVHSNPGIRGSYIGGSVVSQLDTGHHYGYDRVFPPYILCSMICVELVKQEAYDSDRCREVLHVNTQ